MRAFVFFLSSLFLISAAAAQQCPQCTLADACIKQYTQAAAKIKKDSKKGTADQNKGREQTLRQRYSERSVLADQGNMDSMIGAAIDRLKDCLGRVK